MENRRLLLAVVLSIAVLLLWGRFLAPKRSRPADPLPAAVTEPAPAEQPAVTPAPAPEPSAEAPSRAQTSQPVEGSAEKRYTLETVTAIAEFSNRGAQLVSFRLKEHTAKGSEVLDLVRARESAPYPFALVRPDGGSLPVDGALFLATEDPAAQAITFRYRGPAGEVEKRFAFVDDGHFEVDVRAAGVGAWNLLLGPGLGNPSSEESAAKLARRSAVYRLNGEVERLDAQKAEAPRAEPGAGLSWVGLDDNYFLSVLLPRSPLRQARLLPVLIEPGAGGAVARYRPLPPELSKDLKALKRDYLLLLEPEGERLTAEAYFGAKQYARLAKLGQGLDRTIELGWFRFLALPLMFGLQWIYHNVVSNYGWAIVLMTTLIKIVLLPLTHTSMVSAAKMQELNPKMQAVRNKYAGKLKDKQGRPNLEMQRKMNEEMMGLYKTEGVNPAGGCLPILLQLPVFIAFYNILPASVELRHAPWILWIHDLSAHDPYYVLPIVMGVTQFAQQMMMPPMGNPAQRKMMMMMPLVFTVLFVGFPSGLVLYWLTNNVLSIVQQVVYNRLKKKPLAAAGRPGALKAT